MDLQRLDSHQGGAGPDFSEHVLHKALVLVGKNGITGEIRTKSLCPLTLLEYLSQTILVGDSGVGKTSLLVQFDQGKFIPGSFSATVGIGFTNKVVTVDGVRVKLQIWDTAGQERFRSVTHAYYRDAQALLLLYDITNKSSFDNIRAWLTEIHEYAQRDVVIMLLGNKTQRLPAEGGQYLLLGQKRARRGREGPAGVKISFSRVTHLGLTGRCEQRKGDPFGGWGDTGQGVWGSLHGDQR
ncbi:ras-related protein Rab-37 isoform X2 [Manis javanica]|uniref:ras-related protein Rab-37 isoform X2 n=1 Tax=Manis javanica TaxID=9974 RepID=UPI003C6D001C